MSRRSKSSQECLHQTNRSKPLCPPTSSPSSSPWFVQVRQVCIQYKLPDPLFVLANCPSKREWKSASKLRVLDYWTERLRAKASSLSSLELFTASHMSLCRPSPIWTSCNSNQFEVKKATVQTGMGSGSYRTCWLRRHMYGDESGICRVPGCNGTSPGTLLQLATGQCPGLIDAVQTATTKWSNFVLLNPILNPLIQEYARSQPSEFLSFLLDPSTQPRVLALAQEHGQRVVDQLCHLSRTWLYLLHKERFKKLGLWLG